MGCDIRYEPSLRHPQQSTVRVPQSSLLVCTVQIGGATIFSRKLDLESVIRSAMNLYDLDTPLTSCYNLGKIRDLFPSYNSVQAIDDNEVLSFSK